MKKIVLVVVLILGFITNAQILKPVKWTSRTEKISDTEFTLVFEGTIENKWHVYSQFTPDGGPLPLELNFKNKENNYELVGKTAESKTRRAFNAIFGVDEIFFENKIILKQKVKILNPAVTRIAVHISYQVCKEVCINDERDFSFDLSKLNTAFKEVQATTPTTDTFKKQVDVVQPKVTPSVKADTKATAPVKEEEQKGLLAMFIFAFFGGLFATITPCVFPMIPMTVSYFLKQSGSKSKGRFNALFYGFCIIAICILITIPFHLLEGINRDIFSEISTNVYLNIFFFIIFVVFAISFFGAFEITMPSKLTNKVDNASNSGGLLGIFFMALTLIIVSFSCIGPALGFVFGTSLNSDGGATILSIAMLGFGTGLALPFMFFALAPSLLGNLPKSGGWLNTVKVVFGFIELALAFKFLSNADLVLQLHLLEREVFIAIWIAIFLMMAFYLFGKITLPHDSILQSISVGRMLLGLLSLSFTIYLIPGLWGAPLKLISAFTPPQTYSESPNGFGNVAASIVNNESLPEGAVYGPHNIVSFEDYFEGVAYAKKVNKPILIDFTGRACQNCRLMENNVWSDPKVLNILKNEVVLISLYGDERKELPKDQQYISKETGSDIITVGQKWSEFQRQRFGSNARPLYVLLDLKEEKLNVPVPYTPDIDEYYNWLKTGIANFKK
jgi:thiol:disulfide interchange protein DsbD